MTMPHLTRATLPDPAMYTDPAQFARQRAMFARAWHPIEASHIPRESKSAVPFTLLEGCLDEPLVLTRDARGAMHCVSNVCTHRAACVLSEPTHGDSLRCRYHGRRFALDGRFLHAPGFEGALDFPRPADDLPRVALESCGPLWYASLDPAVPFHAWSAPLADTLAFAMETPAVHDPARDRTFELAAHWALYCENYLEGFHIPFVHPELAGAVEFNSYRVEPLEHGVLQTGFATTPDVACFALPRTTSGCSRT
jgi:choline monooxygenase